MLADLNWGARQVLLRFAGSYAPHLGVLYESRHQRSLKSNVCLTRAPLGAHYIGTYAISRPLKVRCGEVRLS